MSAHYERVEDIPPKTCYSISNDGELIMKSAGVPSAWIRADLGGWNVSSNTHNNR